MHRIAQSPEGGPRRLSLWVGWAWIVCATSSSRAPISSHVWS